MKRGQVYYIYDGYKFESFKILWPTTKGHFMVVNNDREQFEISRDTISHCTRFTFSDRDEHFNPGHVKDVSDMCQLFIRYPHEQPRHIIFLRRVIICLWMWTRKQRPEHRYRTDC